MEEVWTELRALPRVVCHPILTHDMVVQTCHILVTPIKKMYSCLVYIARMLRSVI